MKVPSLKPRKLAKEDLNLMETTMKVISQMDSLKDKANITLLILERYIKVSFMRII
jgi:hypothetical protein